jgi:hypothetical protein
VNRATVVEVRRSRHHYEVGLRRSGIQSVDYVIEVANTGQCDALDVGVTDRLPPDFLFASVVRRFGPPYDVVDEPTFPSVGGEVLIRIPVLGPGQTVEFAFLGSVFGRRTLTNTASLAAPGFAGKDSTVYLTPVPAPDAVIRSASATSVQGVTDAPSKGGRAVHRKRARGVVVKLVQVAIARMPSGRASSCAWLANRKGKFRRRACEEPLWLKATGTKQWRLSYKRLKPGRYVVLARALGRNGLSADTFGRGARDSGILRVR